MDLVAQLTAFKSQSINLTRAERVEISCDLAKRLEKVGEYEAAYEALSEFWPERDQTPRLEGLDDPTKANLLLRIGALAGWQGGTDQTHGGQEIAKNLITNSIEIFEGLGQPKEAAEARGDLALCYWREGAFDEARIHLNTALSDLGKEDSERRAVLLIRAGIIEERTRRLQDALRYYDKAAPIVERSEDHALKGSFHFEYGLVLRRLSAPENREDYLDRALIEYAASSFHYEQAGNIRALARVETNLGYLYFAIGRYKEAHEHLDRARELFLQLKERGTAAQVDDTRARTFLAEGHVTEAERLARAAVRILERGDQQAYLAEALTTYGITLARLGRHRRSRAVLEHAVEVAETTGDLEGAGRAKLSIIEELGDRILTKDLVSFYRSAIESLKNSQDPSTGKRLIECAERLLDVLARSENREKSSKQAWEGFSFRQYVRESERAVIERALRDAGGLVTDAAHLLGFKHHQSLIYLINTRHKDLLTTRSPVRRRRRHRFSQPRKTTQKVVPLPLPLTEQVSVLHVEDHELVARTVADTLSSEGIQVDSCSNGSTALKMLKGDKRYDIIILDNSLPGINGLELVTRARSIAHRRATPIIMLSGDDVEREAWRAGVDEFLLKPEAINQIPSTISRLLKTREERAD